MQANKTLQTIPRRLLTSWGGIVAWFLRCTDTASTIVYPIRGDGLNGELVNCSLELSLHPCL